MPYPSQVNRDAIISTARKLIADEGLDRLSLARLARVLGVRAPSLYHHFASKADLLRAINTATMQELMGALRAAAGSEQGSAEARLMAVGRAYHAYAIAHPVAYGMLFTNTTPELYPDAQLSEDGVLPLQDLMAALAGPGDALIALRGAWALLHGFVTLELAGQFRRGGRIEEAWERAFHVYLTGWREHEATKKRER